MFIVSRSSQCPLLASQRRLHGQGDIQVGLRRVGRGAQTFQVEGASPRQAWEHCDWGVGSGLKVMMQESSGEEEPEATGGCKIPSESVSPRGRPRDWIPREASSSGPDCRDAIFKL